MAPFRRRMAGPTTDLPRPFRPRVTTRAMHALHRVLDRRNPLWYAVAVLLLETPPLYRAFTFAERIVKGRLFGCRMCAQCALPATAYACPMTCPKQLRNGPCGGVGADGSCEVYPGMRCVWLIAYERAEAEGRVGDMRRLQRPIDQRKWGQSSWVNYWLGEDEGLWTAEEAIEHEPLLLTPSAGHHS
jgi:methylene-tetrahydrofolate reductase-like protein